jgi:antibiotic biosynthesis monooxygenase (ABM) superfamily enzyme
LPTEEKAKWLEEKMTWAAQEQGTFTAKGWEKWLKQPHKPIS